MIVEHIQGIFSPEHGGPTNSLHKYALGQVAVGLDIRVRVLEGFRGSSPAVRLLAPINQQIFPVTFPGVSGRSPGLKRFLRKESSPNIYHLHGSWLLAMKYGANEASRRNIPYIIEMMGSYQPEELRRKPWRKRLFRHLFQDEILRNAACIQTNSKMEAEQLIALGFRGPFAPIPVGFDVLEADQGEEAMGNYVPTFARDWKRNERFILFLARVHPNKGVELLLEAWRRIASDHKDTRLVIAGAADPSYQAMLVERSSRMPTQDQIEFIGYVSSRDKIWLNRNAWAYCLPSFSENYGATIQDALGYGTPVITTRATPWVELESLEIGWLAETDASSLTSKLKQALNVTPSTRAAMGTKSREWVRAEFSLEKVIEKQIALYQWLLGNAPKPEFVLEG